MRNREWGLPLNARVLAYLEGKPAHSDIAMSERVGGPSYTRPGM